MISRAASCIVIRAYLKAAHPLQGGDLLEWSRRRSRCRRHAPPALSPAEESRSNTGLGNPRQRAAFRISFRPTGLEQGLNAGQNGGLLVNAPFRDLAPPGAKPIKVVDGLCDEEFRACRYLLGKPHELQLRRIGKGSRHRAEAKWPRPVEPLPANRGDVVPQVRDRFDQLRRVHVEYVLGLAGRRRGFDACRWCTGCCGHPGPGRRGNRRSGRCGSGPG